MCSLDAQFLASSRAELTNHKERHCTLPVGRALPQLTTNQHTPVYDTDAMGSVSLIVRIFPKNTQASTRIKCLPTDTQ